MKKLRKENQNMKYTAGFIGAGNMGSALSVSLAKQASQLAIYDIDLERAKTLAEKIKNATATDLEDLVKNSQFIILAVKPNVIIKVASALKNKISAKNCLITMAAGVRYQEIAEAAGTDKVIRIMPNTPAAVGESMILYCCADGITKDEEQKFLKLMSKTGLTDKLDQSLFDAGAALAGCGPAFVYIFAQALADGAVACGLPRDKAALYAAKTIYGSTAMLMQTGKHPEQLKDEVCSPGGTTIAGVLEMEDEGFRYATAKAVIAAFEKTKKLKK